MSFSEEINGFEKFFENIKPSPLNLFLGVVLIVSLLSIFFGLIKDILVLDFEIKWRIIVLICLVFLLIWLKKRHLPIFASDENGILFSFNKINKGVEEEINILYKKVITNIEIESLGLKIKVKILPENITILNPEKAKEIREKSSAKIIVWGDAEIGTIHSQKKDLIVNQIKFTYETRLKEEDKQFFNFIVSNFILNKSWTIDEKEQKIERDYLSRNVSEISLYLIGSALILSNLEEDRSDGAVILKKILKKYKKENNLSDDKKLMVLALEKQLFTYYAVKIFHMNFRLTDKTNKEKIQDGRNLLCEIKDSDIGESYYLLFECILDFLENKKDVIKKLEHMVKLTNEKDSSPFYSLAFVSYHDNNLKDGFKYLKKAISLVTPVSQMPSIVGWYEEDLKDNSYKKYLNFPIGQIYYNLLESADPQRNITKELLSQFVIDYKNDKRDTVIEMIAEAEKMLGKIV